MCKDCASDFNLCNKCGRCPHHHGPTLCAAPIRPVRPPTWLELRRAQLLAMETFAGRDSAAE